MLEKARLASEMKKRIKNNLKRLIEHLYLWNG